MMETSHHQDDETLRQRQQQQQNPQDATYEQTTQDHDLLVEPLLPPQSSSPSSSSSSSSSGTTEDVESSSPTISRNVPLTLLFTFCAFAGRSIWSQSVLATFVYLLTDNNSEDVGFITAVMGIAQLLTSFPSGLLADTYRRDTMLKVASGVGIIAIFTTLFVCTNNNHNNKDDNVNFTYLVMALAVWGCFWGIANTSLSALFADSIPTGKRAKYFTHRSILITVGNTFGPIVALSMFFYLGDKWTVKDCAIVMMAGQLICVPAMVVLCLLNDDYSVHASPANEDLAIVEEQHQQQQSQDRLDRNETTMTDIDGGTSIERGIVLEDENQQCIDEEGIQGNENEQQRNQHNSNDGNTDSHRSTLFGLIPSTRVIPVFVATADLLSGLGSGMSIRYFPIFFVDDLKLGPVLVQVLYFLAPMNQAVLFHVAQRLSKRFGRMRVTVLHKYIGISLMMSMIFVYKAGMPRWFVCVLFVLRTAYMNSTSALTRSMLMDNVPSSERGKWAALESVNMFSWSGSAALGGFLVGKIGVLPLFVVTAFIQFLATIPITALFHLDEVSNTT